MKDAEKLYIERRGNFSPCGVCKYKDGSPYDACYDCVGDYGQFVPNIDLKQFLAKQGYELKEKDTSKPLFFWNSHAVVLLTPGNPMTTIVFFFLVYLIVK